jgi:D-beta-D-heptose 7-phosphate kinase/D-beta-D-heptose 1-phosphate adenosyltransferase
MANFKKAIADFKNKKILVVGDLMLDLYTYGSVSRISPEAPVPILLKTGAKYIPGGAANTAYNLASLGAKVFVFGMIGDDQNGQKLISLLSESGIDTRPIIKIKDWPTILKHRVVASNHQLIRVDEEIVQNLGDIDQEDSLDWIEFLMSKSDAVVLSDYAKGVFSPEFTRALIKLGKKANIFMIADIRPQNKAIFKGVNLLTPNLKEAKEMTNLADVQKIGQSLTKYFSADILMTKGDDGMTVFEKNGEYLDIPAIKIEVFDVSGAGDTVVAVTTLAVASGLNIRDAAKLANFAGGIVVQKPGTATVTTEELEASLQDKGHVELAYTVPKVWGYEKWLENNDKYCSKLLSLKKGYQCSLHFHKLKDEMFLVTLGHVRFELGDEILHMMPGSFIRVSPGVKHRFRGMEDSEILEISTHHSEEDSYRIEESRKVEEKVEKEISDGEATLTSPINNLPTQRKSRSVVS